MLEALILLPLVAGVLMLAVGNAAFCRALLPLTGAGHAALSLATVAAVASGERPSALGGLMAPAATVASESAAWPAPVSGKSARQKAALPTASMSAPATRGRRIRASSMISP